MLALDSIGVLGVSAVSLGGVIRAAAFCPHPPLLVPAVASGAAPELDDLRAACRAAIRSVVDRTPRLLLLGSAADAVIFNPGSRGSLAGYGVSVDVWLGGSRDDGPAELPLALTIGAWLVADAAPDAEIVGGIAVAADSPPPAVPDDVALVVLGDGSARRSTTAPGYLDERAAGFDAAVSTALATGDAAALRDLDAGVGAELLAAGVPAWRAAGVVLASGDYAGRRRYDAAPYGVGYIVADWQARD